jgi:predicted O-linked N-acetylglucosamine transferase (SPINDLY family)
LPLRGETSFARPMAGTDAKQYTRRRMSDDQADNAFLRDTRRRLAKHWLATPGEDLPRAYLGDLGRLQRLLTNAALRFEELEPGEEQVAQELAAKAKGGDVAGGLLGAMLYWRAHRLELSIDLTRVPPWLIKDLLAWQTAPVAFFAERGEPARFASYLSNTIETIRRNAAAEINGAVWQNAALLVANRLDVTPTYANDENLIDLQRSRGELLTWVAKKTNAPLENAFAPAPKGRKPRIGVIARHFRPSAETFALLPVYEHLKDEGFDVIVYVCDPANHPLAQYCAGRASAARLLPPDPANRRKIILGDDLDLLFYGTNLSTASTDLVFLAQHRLARVQVTGVANVVTTGLPSIDYFLSGTSSDPSPDAPSQYTERLFRMDGSAHCFAYGPASANARQLSRTDLGLKDEHVVLVSGANLYKITPELMEAWKQVLDSSGENATLLLLPFGPNWYASYPDEAFRRHARRMLGERVRIVNPQPPPDRVQLREIYRACDIYLDSFPFGGSTSLIEPLEVGLPIVTRAGSTFRSAMAGAILREIGMEELVAPDEARYVALAIELARDANRRRDVSRRIHDRMLGRPSFLDSAGHAKRVAAAFRAMLTGRERA